MLLAELPLKLGLGVAVIQDAPDAKALAARGPPSLEFHSVSFSFVPGSPVLHNGEPSPEALHLLAVGPRVVNQSVAELSACSFVCGHAWRHRCTRRADWQR